MGPDCRSVLPSGATSASPFPSTALPSGSHSTLCRPLRSNSRRRASVGANEGEERRHAATDVVPVEDDPLARRRPERGVIADRVALRAAAARGIGGSADDQAQGEQDEHSCDSAHGVKRMSSL